MFGTVIYFIIESGRLPHNSFILIFLALYLIANIYSIFLHFKLARIGTSFRVVFSSLVFFLVLLFSLYKTLTGDMYDFSAVFLVPLCVILWIMSIVFADLFIKKEII